jgi:hypothetical protein
MMERNLSPAEAAQRAYAEHLIWAAEFNDMAARAAGIGDIDGASRYHRHAHEHSRQAWRALVGWRGYLDQQNGARSCA